MVWRHGTGTGFGQTRRILACEFRSRAPCRNCEVHLLRLLSSSLHTSRLSPNRGYVSGAPSRWNCASLCDWAQMRSWQSSYDSWTHRGR